MRRQFFLSINSNFPYPGWLSVQTQGAILHHTPDLPVVRSSDGCITLIGYAIDPASPAASDREIVADIAKAATLGLDDSLRICANLGGRWALLIEKDAYQVMLHDACGLRQVFYSDDTHAPPFCASQASTAGKVLGLESDPEAVKFLDTNFAALLEYGWPSDSTRFHGVKCLLPNHYLDLRTRKPHRFGLDQRIGHMSAQAAANEGMHLLANLIRGAALRFPVALPLTAGWDSRVILAACCKAGIEPHGYTLRFDGYDASHQDLVISRRLLRRLNLPHQIIDCPPEASDAFRAEYHSAVSPAEEAACAIAEGLRAGYPAGHVSLSGHCSEIARCYFYPHGQPTHPMEPKTIAKLTNMNPTPWVLAQFEHWASDVEQTVAVTGLSWLDLFYWEQCAGRWAGNGQAQWDIIHERLTPYCCRPLLLALLSTDASVRSRPFELYRLLIKAGAPRLLREPINPATAPANEHRRVKSTIKKVLKYILR